MEYLVTMTTHVPAGTPEQAVDDIRAREAAHSRELAGQGHLLRLWRPPLQPPTPGSPHTSGRPLQVQD
jgi:muconolactone D-isomerase